MNFQDAVKTCFQQYTTFTGRAARSEYWFFYLFWVIVYSVASVIHPALAGIFALATLLPWLSVAVRRLHDIDRSGWWLLLLFIPIIGALVLLFWDCTKGTAGDNRFGADPLA